MNTVTGAKHYKTDEKFTGDDSWGGKICKQHTQKSSNAPRERSMKQLYSQVSDGRKAGHI